MSSVTTDNSKAACDLRAVWCKIYLTCWHQKLMSAVMMVLELSGLSENAGLALILHVEVEI